MKRTKVFPKIDPIDTYSFNRSWVCLPYGHQSVSNQGECDLCLGPIVRLLGVFDPGWWPTQGRGALYSKGFAIIDQPGTHSLLVATREPVEYPSGEIESLALSMTYPKGVEPWT